MRARGVQGFAAGVILTYEAVRYWCRKFGQAYANRQEMRRQFRIWREITDLVMAA
jgi:hypothetical protein